MSQEYKLLQFRPSDFKDNFGNTWCDIALEGVSEPVKWVVKDPAKIQVGNTYYGRIEQKQSKANKPYQRFYKEEKPEEKQQRESRDEHIRAQWAIGQALSKFPDRCYEAMDEDRHVLLQNIQGFASELFAMVDNVVEGYKSEPEPTVNKGPINIEDLPY